eukprot:CAMPEP_0170535776 /NCGR_PEP_ID=MMETSP0209-20121228/101787_1 /TAXON_ID=665100 ORGANISM="Litonotus pictus, Strain P1" /NCGR_SAMPLE_ID=MMETSP0209 /ASSEMBLY_ACC=CAM_ASM_000301 /LENGTH=321 /DNA_ID=CAMNT_0010837075 /DNA_START=201 /DNA_END=1166 /DNA_ORIENTATION=-
MTRKDAYLFPVIGCCTLGGLFLAFKYLDKDYINIVFHYYFSVIGVFVMASFFYNRLKDSLPAMSEKVIFTVPTVKWMTDAPTPFDLLYFILLVISSVIGAAYFITKHYYLNNVYGIFFSLIGIESVMMGGTNVGFILLVLLFFYDIYWVFFTPVMVTVAKNLEGPIKLMFPKKFDWEGPKDFNMIGLGDIVIPGVYVALMLRFDYLKTLERMRKNKEDVPTDSKGNHILPFSMGTFGTFLWTFMGYFMGILTTLVIMNVFQHAQPALLYLVPGVLLGSAFSALIQGVFFKFWGFEESKELENLGLKEPEPTVEEKKEEKDK